MIWAVMAVVAILIAFDKSFLPGAGMFGIGLLASVVPAKEASGTTLTMLIVADWIAIWAYRKDVDWHTLRHLLPNVVVGVVLGAGFLFVADDEVTKRTIGAILLVFIVVNLLVMARRRARDRHEPVPAASEVALVASALADDEPRLTRADERTRPGPQPTGAAAHEPADVDRGRAGRGALVKRTGYGALAGFTTMVANAGGPVTSLYFMSEGFPVMRFLGTTAWFYLIINLVKLPFSAGLGMIHPSTLVMVAAMVPVIAVTVLFGRWLAKRVDRGVFNTLVVVLTFATAIELLV